MITADDRKQNLSLYLSLPFCRVRCAYCDFNTYAGLDDLMAPYARALATEIRMVGVGARENGCRAAHTIFFGGGTPSLLPLELYAEIFAALREAFALTPDCEITLEANPGTVEKHYLEGLRALGVNRLSFGVQSTHPSELQLLDRLHSFDDVVRAVRWARAAGFDPRSNGVNLDLIFGIPHQTMAMWRETLARALALQPDHLSCYALSLEHGTPMRAWVYRGLLPTPDPDLAADMYEWASETLEAHGFVQYEISNWARCQKSEVRSQKSEGIPSDLRPLTSNLQHACRHNLQYWRNLPYLGFGAGAHGCAEGYRYSNVLSPAAYIERVERGGEATFPFSPALAEAIPVTREDEMGETMMLGMRLVGEGVVSAEFEQRFGLTLEARYGKELRELQQLGLIEWDGERTRLTKRGRLLGNRVFREFV
jgi:oxygen-independent coproporphyrinogen-3 oxidase